jgi:regulator of cell morphogenesis and NO signaling
MPATTPEQAPEAAVALIELILRRFHDGHRRAFPTLLARARAWQAAGGPADTEARMQAFVGGLELHMFKEEMRLFPMMEQGGNTLIGHLIDDLHHEHRAHALAGADLQRLLASASSPAPALQSLREAFDSLAAELREHIRAEDEILFPMFKPAAGAAAGSA